MEKKKRQLKRLVVSLTEKDHRMIKIAAASMELSMKDLIIESINRLISEEKK